MTVEKMPKSMLKMFQTLFLMTIFINSFELDIGNDNFASAFIQWLYKRYLSIFGQQGRT